MEKTYIINRDYGSIFEMGMNIAELYGAKFNDVADDNYITVIMDLEECDIMDKIVEFADLDDEVIIRYFVKDEAYASILETASAYLEDVVVAPYGDYTRIDCRPCQSLKIDKLIKTCLEIFKK